MAPKNKQKKKKKKGSKLPLCQNLAMAPAYTHKQQNKKKKKGKKGPWAPSLLKVNDEAHMHP